MCKRMDDMYTVHTYIYRCIVTFHLLLQHQNENKEQKGKDGCRINGNGASEMNTIAESDVLYKILSF